MTHERVVDSFGPFDLLHRTVGANRYWYVTHRPTGKHAVAFDGAPCIGHVRSVRDKFRRMVAAWPDMGDFDANNMQTDDVARLKSLRDMFERDSPTSYRLAP